MVGALESSDTVCKTKAIMRLKSQMRKLIESSVELVVVSELKCEEKATYIPV